MISFTNAHVIIHALNDLTARIIFHALRASRNACSKCPICWNDSRHAPLWWLYLHCRIEVTSSTGIIGIVSHQILRHPSKHGTSSMGKHMLAKAHIVKLNELTKSEVTKLTSSTVGERALSRLTRQGIHGISNVCSQWKFIFDIQILFILTEVTDRMLQTSSEGLSKSWFSPRHLESQPHVRICFGSYSTQHYFKPAAMMVVHCIPMRIGAAVRQHAEQHLLEGVHTDSGCNYKAITIKK